MKITDFKLTFKDMDSALRATQMFELRRQISLSVMDGKFKEARKHQKELAKTALEDFETYKKLPFLHFLMPGMSLKDYFSMAFNSFKFKMFSKFSKKTNEEKQFRNLAKEYYNSLTKDEIKKNTIDITIPSIF